MVQSDNFYQLLKNNRREVNGFQYTVPAPSSYPYQSGEGLGAKRFSWSGLVVDMD